MTRNAVEFHIEIIMFYYLQSFDIVIISLEFMCISGAIEWLEYRFVPFTNKMC